MTSASHTLESKLKSSIKQRQIVEAARQEQVRLLSAFISKLSLVCKGQDLELDNRLASFRKLFKQGIDFEQMAPLLKGVDEIINRHDKAVAQQFRQLSEHVKNSGSALQKQKGLTDNTRRELRKLLSDEFDQVQSLPEFIPLITRLNSLYEQVVQSISQAPSGGAAIQTRSDKLVDELRAIVNELILEEDYQEKLFKLKKSIVKANSDQELLVITIAVMRLVMDSLELEREATREFVVALNGSLHSLSNALGDTAKRSEQLNSKLDHVYSQIGANISELNDQTRLATDLSTLKKIVEQQLNKMAEQLAHNKSLSATHSNEISSGLSAANERIAQLEQQLAEHENKLDQQRLLATHDSLTHLPNRHAFEQRFSEELKKSAPFTLAVIDIDHFKSINDNYGHLAGDKTLQVMAATMKKITRDNDFIARYGGEEFVLLLPNTSIDDGKEVVQKLRLAIRAIPFKFKEKQVQITMSSGVTAVKSDDQFNDAFDRADQALYRAKEQGRDRVVLV